jgi:hypothetical protein
MSTSCDGLAWRPEQQQMGRGGVVYKVFEFEWITLLRERKRWDAMIRWCDLVNHCKWR